MASDMVKVTFTVDALTADLIRELAEAWEVPKSEAVSRAIRQAKERQLLQKTRRTAVAVLEHLEQETLLSARERKARFACAVQLPKHCNPTGKAASESLILIPT